MNTKKHCSRVCAPSSECVAAVHGWALGRRRPGFRVKHALGLKHLTVLLPALLDCNLDQPVQLVDVGAGIHNLFGYELKAQDLHEDDSDALWLLAGFQHAADVHAFEINHLKALELQQAAATRPMTQHVAQRLHIHTTSVGDHIVGNTARIALCGAENTWSISAARPDCQQGSRINHTTMDAYFARSAGRLLYVKIDVEGAEVQVLRGMHHLLNAGMVDIISLEYAFGWNAAFDDGFSSDRRTTRQAKKGETLKLTQAMLDQVGYDTYLIHAEQADPRVPIKKPQTMVDITLVPVYGPYWHDEFEICLRTNEVYGRRGCWTDLLVVRRCMSPCLKRMLLRQLTNTSRFFRSACTPECF